VAAATSRISSGRAATPRQGLVSLVMS
jgi:hypothetical protein